MARKYEGKDNKITVKLTGDETRFLSDYRYYLTDMREAADKEDAKKTTTTDAIHCAIFALEKILSLSPDLQEYGIASDKISKDLLRQSKQFERAGESDLAEYYNNLSDGLKNIAGFLSSLYSLALTDPGRAGDLEKIPGYIFKRYESLFHAREEATE